MKITLDECDFDDKWAESGIRLHHRPTGRCIATMDTRVTKEELFIQLQEEINRLEASGELHLKSTRIIIEDGRTIH